MKLIIRGLLTAILFLGISVQAQVVQAPVSTGEPRELSVKEKVELVFKDSPIMIRKLRCESGYRQFDSAGHPLISKTLDVGVGQLNLPSWEKKAESMGLDIRNSVDDNLLMARFIFDHGGSGQWNAPATKDCLLPA